MSFGSRRLGAGTNLQRLKPRQQAEKEGVDRRRGVDVYHRVVVGVRSDGDIERRRAKISPTPRSIVGIERALRDRRGLGLPLADVAHGRKRGGIDSLGEFRPRDKGETKVNPKTHEQNQNGQAECKQHEDLGTLVSSVVS